VLVHNLPPESACARVQSTTPPGWNVSEFLLADLYHALTGEAHPNRPKGPSRYSGLRARLEAQRARLGT
jgi:hypothetical protein